MTRSTTKKGFPTRASQRRNRFAAIAQAALDAYNAAEEARYYAVVEAGYKPTWTEWYNKRLALPAAKL